VWRDRHGHRRRPGTGSGYGEGFGGGTGGGVYREGNGVTSPVPIRDPKPNYTSEAMRARIQGLVTMEAVVLPDGSVGDVHVVKSLDRQFGLDQEAVNTVQEMAVPARDAVGANRSQSWS
jgi:TonB family protein